MSPESLFRIAFWVVIGLVLAMRFYFIFRLRRSGGHVMPDQAAIRREGRRVFAFRLVGFFVLWGLFIGYAIWPTAIETLSIPLPAWLRWTGFALGLASVAFWTWVQATLGTEWSAQLRLRDTHHLITTGPYARSRHPMYTAIFGFAVSLALLSTNWCFIILAVLVIAGLVVRVPHEEQMMIEAFGEAYRAYMRKTRRYFPKWLAETASANHAARL